MNTRYLENFRGKCFETCARMNVRKHVRFAVLLVLTLALAWGVTAQMGWPAPDAAAISKFQDEGLQRSQIWRS